MVSVGGEAGKSAKGGDALVLMVPSTKPELTLGRGPSNDLVIDDATVSTSHLTLTLRGKSWAARTLSSTNGTWLGQRPLEASKEAQLSSDDQLRLGQVNLTFYDSKGLYFRLKSGG